MQDYANVKTYTGILDSSLVFEELLNPVLLICLWVPGPSSLLAKWPGIKLIFMAFFIYKDVVAVKWHNSPSLFHGQILLFLSSFRLWK